MEFLLYGLASHLTHLPEFQSRRYESLNAETFLRGDLANQKATLGQLVRDFSDKLLITSEELGKFVEDRNLIAHNYWRLVHANIQGGQSMSDPRRFLQDFANRCAHWENVLRGFLALAKIVLAERSGTAVEISNHERNCIEIYNSSTADYAVRKLRMPPGAGNI